MALKFIPDDVDHDEDHGDHASDATYVRIAIILAVLTAIEVFLFVIEEQLFDSLGAWSLYAGLSVLMIIKFWLVVREFMHLKQDTVWFSYLFFGGLVLAMGVYLIFFLSFDLFGLGGGADPPE